MITAVLIACWKILKTKDKEKFLYTLEFFPEEGKYHWDGHRKCGVNIPPQETKNLNDKCPKCGGKITVGVLHRVEKLCNREEGFVLKNAPPYKSLVPLIEIIASAMDVGKDTQTAGREYNILIKKFGTEFKILLEAPEDKIKSECPERIAEGILNMKKGNVEIVPGSDGVYGKVSVLKSDDGKKEKQLELF